VEINLLFAAGVTADEKTAIIADVLEALNDTTARPISDTVSVREADVIQYTLNIQYTADGDSAENMAIKLQEAANEYQAWQEGAVGRQFDPYRLLAALYNAGATRAEWDAASNLNSSAVAYTKMEAYQRLTGTITLSVLEESP
jgi:phage-related baseplate assembly protein